MALVFTPDSSLKFKGPFTQRNECHWIIANPHALATTFKVKTTAPKRYYVRPNGGRIEPGASVDVLVIMEALAEEPPPGTACKDKFLVESSLIPAKSKFHRLREIMGREGQVQLPEIHKRKFGAEYLFENSTIAAKDGDLQASNTALDSNPKAMTHRSQPSEAESCYSPALQDVPPAYSAVQDPETREEARLDSSLASAAESSRIAELSAQVEAAQREIERLEATVEAMSLHSTER
ncbi:putative MSP (Major sperm protein) domain containing protein [Lyophyllum shimeji]|uniref:MSP (Major sperm protein) domain containing protein n=1 Tax=Lyophyllum shimeji TaxID=47721 RepID=A0A9P3UKB0_LYOSH|nr:putative MSP (Major sperm protein) domain containing protein [Lyophyllum shimeji]